MFKSVRRVHGGHHGLYPIGQTNIYIFSMKFLKFYLTGVWNESCSIARKWSIYQIYCRSILTKQTSLYKVLYRTFLFNPNNCNLTTQVELFFHIFSIHAQFACGWTFTTCGRTTARTQARLANTHTKDTSRFILWTDCVLRTTARNRRVFIVNHCWNRRQMHFHLRFTKAVGPSIH